MFLQVSVCKRGGRAWLPGGMRGEGVCMVKGVCVAKDGVCGKGGHAW